MNTCEQVQYISKDQPLLRLDTLGSDIKKFVLQAIDNPPFEFPDIVDEKLSINTSSKYQYRLKGHTQSLKSQRLPWGLQQFKPIEKELLLIFRENLDELIEFDLSQEMELTQEFIFFVSVFRVLYQHLRMTASTLKQVTDKLTYVNNQWEKYQKTMAQLDPIMTYLSKEVDLNPVYLMSQLFKREINIDNKVFFSHLKAYRLQKFKDLVGDNYVRTPIDENQLNHFFRFILDTSVDPVEVFWIGYSQMNIRDKLKEFMKSLQDQTYEIYDMALEQLSTLDYFCAFIESFNYFLQLDDMNILRRITMKWPCENLIVPIGLRFVENSLIKQLEPKVQKLYAQKQLEKKSDSISSSGLIEANDTTNEILQENHKQLTPLERMEKLVCEICEEQNPLVYEKQEGGFNSSILLSHSTNSTLSTSYQKGMYFQTPISREISQIIIKDVDKHILGLLEWINRKEHINQQMISERDRNIQRANQIMGIFRHGHRSMILSSVQSDIQTQSPSLAQYINNGYAGSVN